MNLTTLSLYPGCDVCRPVPTNQERIALYRFMVAPPLENGVFMFRNETERSISDIDRNAGVRKMGSLS